jgi:CRISPR-associated protein Cmr5
MSMEKSLDLQRAEHALKAVEVLKKKSIGHHYVSYVKAMPANILQNGLGQGLATLLSAAKGKSEDAHHLLYDQIQTWLCRQHEDAPYAGKPELMQSITNGSEDAYLHAHAEALAYLVWLKKFAVAFLKEPDQGEVS